MIEGMTARLILSLALFPSTACLASAGGEGSLSFYLRICETRAWANNHKVAQRNSTFLRGSFLPSEPDGAFVCGLIPNPSC